VAAPKSRSYLIIAVMVLLAIVGALLPLAWALWIKSKAARSK
jgi:hypothetical protein